MRTELITDALAHAIRRRGAALTNKVIFHSDRGSQYVSDDMHKFCAANSIWQSMGAKATCFDNAAAESFFATFKRELIHRHVWEDPKILRSAVFEWIEPWYNQTRRHSAIGNIAPNEMHKHQMALAA